MLELAADDLAWPAANASGRAGQLTAAVRTSNYGIEGVKVEQPQEFRLAQGPQDAVAPEHVRQVDERTGHGRDRNPVLDGYLFRVQLANAVNPNAG